MKIDLQAPKFILIDPQPSQHHVVLPQLSGYKVIIDEMDTFLFDMSKYVAGWVTSIEASGVTATPVSEGALEYQFIYALEFRVSSPFPPQSYKLEYQELTEIKAYK